MYQAGHALVAGAGVRMSEVIWDADDVLWDWLVDMRAVVRGSRRMVLHRDLGHREHFRIQPGIFELLWGMRHASLQQGLDPHMRVWTNGYPWRLWRIAQQVPGWDALLGPPADSAHQTHESYVWHPRVFCRADFARATRELLRPGARVDLMQSLPPAVRAVLLRQLRFTPYDSTLKLPELAGIAGKDGFAGAAVLVDDQERNVVRFAASGRRGVHACLPRPRAPFSNAVWTSPMRALEQRSTRISESVARALARVMQAPAGCIERAACTEPLRDYPFIDFFVDIPDAIVRAEWIEPVRSLRRLAAGWRSA
jgi:hypothetical protein